MKVVLIGGAGFIGSLTAFELLAAGHEAVVFDSLDPQIHGSEGMEHLPRLREHARVVQGDTRDGESMDRCLEGAEAVYYFPACTGTGQSMYRAGMYCDVNVHGAGVFADVLQKHRHTVSRVIVSSSRAVYGEGAAHCSRHGRVFPATRNAEDLNAGRFEITCPHCAEPVSPLASLETDRVSPASIYGITKLAQEMIVANVCSSVGIPAVVFRYQNVYGPGQSLKNPYTGILSIFTQLLLDGKSINVFEDGLPSRDFVFVDDVVEYNVRALKTSLEGSMVLNVGSGVRKTIFDLVHAVGDALGQNAVHFVSGDFRLGDIRHAEADTNRLFEVLGRHQFVGLDEGVKSFVDWVVSLDPSRRGNSSFEKSLDEMRNAGLLRTAKN